MKGGTLPELVQLAAAGEAWADDTVENRIRWFRFLAHEAFHLWNGQLFQLRGPHWHEWLTEGSADYYADRALLELQIIDAVEYELRRKEAANSCLISLEGHALLDQPRARSYRSFYVCGQTLLQLLDVELKAVDASMSVDELFVRLFETSARELDSRYNTTHFLSELFDMTDDAMTASVLLSVLLGPASSQPVQLLADALHSRFGDTFGPISTAQLQQTDAALAAVRLASECACGSATGLRVGTDGKIRASPDCGLEFEPTDALAGHHIWQESGAALQAARNGLLDGTVQVGATPVECREDSRQPQFEYLVQ